MILTTTSSSLPEDAEIPPPDWEAYIDSMISNMLKDQSPQQILQVRSMLYDLLTHCIPASLIMKEMTTRLLTRVDPVLQPAIVSLGAKFEHRLQLGSKAIFHLEAFVANFMKLLATYLTGIEV